MSPKRTTRRSNNQFSGFMTLIVVARQDHHNGFDLDCDGVMATDFIGSGSNSLSVVGSFAKGSFFGNELVLNLLIRTRANLGLT